tara:strand:+ start:7228 stop:8412 length:1185 start_codon:yes stop_codon:yes gene_type:complete
MYFGYIFYYFTRSSLKISGLFFINDGILTKYELGLVLSLSSLAYAFSKFFMGVLTDLTSPRVLMSIGLLVSGVLNLLVVQSRSFYLILILWIFNGIFQGCGWPPVAKMLTNWFTQKERGSWWGLWSTSHNISEFFLNLIYAFLANNWLMGFYLPGFISVLFSFALFFGLRSSPEEVELEPIVEMHDSSESFKKKKGFLLHKLFSHVFTNAYVWTLIISSVFIYFVRGSISAFLTIFLVERGYSYSQSILIRSFFEFGGMLGSFLSGFASDRLFDGKRSLVNILFSIGIAIFSYLSWVFTDFFYLELLFIFLTGFFVYGPQMLIGLSIAEVSNRDAVSTSTGFAGLWSYISISFAYFITPRLSSSSFFLSLIISGFFAMIFFIPLISVDYFKKER